MSAEGTVSWAYRVPAMTLDGLSDALDIAGVAAAGLSEENGVATAWFDHRPVATMPIPGTWDAVRQEDWSESWKAGLRPITVGRITVTVPWLAPEGHDLTGDPPYTIVIEPGMAFGTGHHETTRSCLAALQDLDLWGCRVIDVGTGTGVLALAAVALGARQVVGVDTDDLAIEVAEANVLAHGLANDGSGPIALAVGSCAAAGDAADVVIANIITDKLMALAADLVNLVAPGGTLIASGVATDRVAEAITAFARAGLVMTGTPGEEWAVLRGRRPA